MLAKIQGSKNEKLKVLDIGCGYGKYLRILKEQGYDVTGIDVNRDSVNYNLSQNLKCLHVSELKQIGDLKFDILLMSHIIEHFEPAPLLSFIESYLPYLSSNGHLIVCTPLFSSHFYNDFDHIKPYQPYGFNQIFNTPDGQIQFKSKYQLVLEDLHYRVYPFRITHARGLYIKSWTTPLIKFFNNLMGIICILSGRVIAKKDGWIGMFKRI
jgi:2-polyprenyl-3-methyl-5-hydroxy-6-metoxy-1,4-benzoquinol methylase